MPFAGGFNVSMSEPVPLNKPAQSILYLEGVSVSFDGFKALNSLNLILSSVNRTPTLGMIGPSPCKSPS